jgi:hypothetical protein
VPKPRRRLPDECPDGKPKLRYPAGSRAAMVSTMRRVVPSRAFDRQIRKLNQLAG